MTASFFLKNFNLVKGIKQKAMGNCRFTFQYSLFSAEADHFSLNLQAMMNQTFEEGRVILIDKPLDWTSFDVVKKIRNILRIKKIGHAGTLDPLASGLLILCTGKYTKRINQYMAAEKEYTGSITLGAVTPTFDLESEPQQHKPFDHISEEEILRTAHKFTGDILQVPPIHSAVKQKGKPVYLKARKGEDVILEPRKIHISGFEIDHIELPQISFKVNCSTGTYIRSLANDFGAALGCGGYLSGLRRTAIGEFRVEDAMDMETFIRKFRDRAPDLH